MIIWLLHNLVEASIDLFRYLCRTLRANEPGKQLSISVTVKHPQLGQFFAVMLKMGLSSVPEVPSERAGLRILLRCVLWE